MTDTNTTDDGGDLDEPITKRDVRVVSRKAVEGLCLVLALALVPAVAILASQGDALGVILFGATAAFFVALERAHARPGLMNESWNATFGRLGLPIETTTADIEEADA